MPGPRAGHGRRCGPRIGLRIVDLRRGVRLLARLAPDDEHPPVGQQGRRVESARHRHRCGARPAVGPGVVDLGPLLDAHARGPTHHQHPPVIEHDGARALPAGAHRGRLRPAAVPGVVDLDGGQVVAAAERPVVVHQHLAPAAPGHQQPAAGQLGGCVEGALVGQRLGPHPLVSAGGEHVRLAGRRPEEAPSLLAADDHHRPVGEQRRREAPAALREPPGQLQARIEGELGGGRLRRLLGGGGRGGRRGAGRDDGELPLRPSPLGCGGGGGAGARRGGSQGERGGGSQETQGGPFSPRRSGPGAGCQP